LAIALLCAAGAFTIYLAKFAGAQAEIEKQQQELEEQRKLIEQKETFGAAMETLLDRGAQFEGVLTTSIVPVDRFKVYAAQAWAHRWNSPALDRDIKTVETATTSLDEVQASAGVQSSTNSTGSEFEAVIDRLGQGFVTSVIDDADAFCNSDVLACVSSSDPYKVHFDTNDNSQPFMTDWLRTGVAYHEFAHVLQMTNPAPTEVALDAFGDDVETMADCFALTYLDGWTLDHRIWSSSYSYWEVNVGYGYTCDDGQKQVIRDWYGQLGYHPETISSR
jgi:hypothetical protein